MGAPELHWQIARSKLPPFLKLTMFVLALVAEAKHGFANIYFAKRTIGQLSSRSERIAFEDVDDLERFGVLTCLERSKGRTASRYQIIWDRLSTWSAADTEKLAEMRRLRRLRTPRRKKKQPGSVQQGSRRRKVISNPDPYSSATRIRTAAQPGSVLPGSTPSDDPSEGTDVAGDQRPVHAVENQLADDDSASPAVAPHSNGAAFRLMADAGRRFLAGEQSGEFPRSELRAELQRVALRCSFASELAESVCRFLEVQHQHRRANAGASPDSVRGSGKGVPAAPPEKTPVRPSGEVRP